MRAILFVLIAGVSFSTCPLAAHSKDSVVKASKTNKELQKKLDILKVEHILDSVSFLENVNVMIGDNEFQELELGNVLENWQKYCKTKFDRWGMKKLLQHAPKGSKEIIRLMVEKDDRFKVLDEIIEEVKKGEDELIAYWDQGNRLHYDAQGLYYSIFSRWAPKANNFLNSSTAALEASQVLGIIKPFLNIFALLGISGIVNGFIMSKAVGLPFDWKKSFINGIKAPIRSHNIFPAIYKDEYDVLFSSRVKAYQGFVNGTLGDKYLLFKVFLKMGLLNKISDNDNFKNKLAAFLSAGTLGALTAFNDYRQVTGIKGSIERIIFLHKTAAALQHNLVKIADIVRVLGRLEELQVIAQDEDSFALHTIKKYLKREGISRRLNRLLDLLNSSTFKSPASFFYSRGRLLNTHRLFVQIKQEVLPLLQHIALLGGYRAIAQMVRENKNSKVGYCFINVVQHDAPCIGLKNAWIPLIAEEKVVFNDYQLGAKGFPSNAVFTGPNGGGKTTSMITVAFNVLLSRLGIAAADEAYISDFSTIRTSLHPTQNIKDGLSSFMAEHKRVSDVLKDIDSCKGNILVLMDEPYKGTVEAESASRVYKFGKNLAKENHCMLLMATHLRKPIELADDLPEIFANYQMGYLDNSADSASVAFKRTFKVLDGPAIWWFDDAEKRAQFIDWLCENEVK